MLKRFFDLQMIVLLVMVVLVAGGVVYQLAFVNRGAGLEFRGGRYFIGDSWALILVEERRVLPDGVTADLSGIKRNLLKILGVEIERIYVYRVARDHRLPPDSGGYTANYFKEGSLRKVPDEQIGWGIKTIYNNPNISFTTGGEGIDVAVLDTGVNRNLPDLKRRVAECKDFTGEGIKENECTDFSSHGTITSAIVVADAGEDGFGMYGVAPEANIFAYKVCGDDGRCFTDDIAVAVRYAADKGAEIIFISPTGITDSRLVREAVEYAIGRGVLVISPTGDGGRIHYPAVYASVVAVGFIDEDENVDGHSGLGVNDGDFIIEENEVEFVAPGFNVWSLWNDGRYDVLSTASMGAAHIVGLAAKVWQGSGEATREYLRSLARDIGEPGDDLESGFGLPQLSNL